AAVSHGVRWGVIDQTVQVVVRLGATVVLARLVAPEAFGLIGLALVVVNFALVLSGLGLGPALVQKRDLTPHHVTTAFTTTAAFAWGFAMAEKVWRPTVGFDRGAFRDLIGFSAFVTGSKLVAYGQGNGDNLVIGRVLGTAALGYYALAYRIMLLPLQRFGEVV